jgi:hypothetical protein
MGLFSRATTVAPTARIRRANLTASASTVSGDNAKKNRRLHQDWQARALDYYNTIGECWYPAQFYARTLSSVRFFPAILDEKGDPQEVETGPLVDLFERIQDPGGGRSDLTGSYGRLMFLTGDGYLTVGLDEDSDEEAWEFLSPLELRVKPDSGAGRRQEYLRLRAPGASQEELIEAPDDAFEPIGNEVRVWRLWRRHPGYSLWADSPVRAVLDLYELLRTLTASAGAESTSRLDRGGFYLPNELVLSTPPEDGGNEDSSIDIFLQEWQEGLTAAIKSPGEASAMSPIVLTGPAFLPGANGTALPMKDAIGYFQIGRQNDYKEAEMWDKTILRISYGLDLPRERVTGVGDLNHWSGWLVDEEGFRQHVAPVAEKFCADVNAAYLRPAAMAEGIPQADRVVIGYDPADAINHPDEVKTAREAYLAAVVGGDFYRERIGATEADEPDEEEKAFILALQGKSLPGEEVDPEAETNPADGGRGGDTVEEPPVIEDAQQNGNDNGQNARVAAARIGAAIEVHLEQARSTAGNRLVARSQGCEECKDTIKGVPVSLVASALGPEQVRDIIDGHTTEAHLVSGTGERVAATVTRWGIPSPAATELGSLVEQHALRTLYEPDAPALPDDLALAVKKALAA